MPTSPSLPPAKAGLSVASNGDIWLHGSPLPLPPKESAVLRLLLWQWPDRVSKEDFDLQVWHGGMTDEGLARAVANLRRLLRNLRGLRIRSVYGKGYQLFIQPQRGAEKKTYIPTSAELDTLSYARQRIQLGSQASLATANQLLQELMACAPQLHEARIAYAECLAAMVAAGCEIKPGALDQALNQLDLLHRQAPALTAAGTLQAHLLDCCWRFDEARPLHQKAIHKQAQDPASHLHWGWHLLACGDHRAAIDVLEHALKLAPFSLPITLLLAHACLIAGDDQRFAHWIDKAQQDHPENSKAIIWKLVHQAITAPDNALLEQARQMLLDEQSWIIAYASQVFVLACCGADDEVQASIARHAITDRCEQVLLASSLLRIGDGDQALEIVRNAAALGYGALPLYLRSPTFSALESLPGYQDDVHLRVFARLP